METQEGEGEAQADTAEVPVDTAQQQTESLVRGAVFEESTARAHGPLDYKRAAALRFKYRVPSPDGSGKHRQPPSWVGHHPRNRDRTRMSAERCEELLEELLGQFDGDEADHDSVCVSSRRLGPQPPRSGPRRLAIPRRQWQMSLTTCLRTGALATRI